MDRDTWEVMLSKRQSKFVKELAVKMWGSEGLAIRCLDDVRANEHNTPGALFRRPLTPEKYESLKGILDITTSSLITLILKNYNCYENPVHSLGFEIMRQHFYCTDSKIPISVFDTKFWRHL